MKITFDKEKKRRSADADVVIVSADKKPVARIQRIDEDRWFWYGRPGGVLVNTSHSPKSLEDCKQQAKESFLELGVS